MKTYTIKTTNIEYTKQFYTDIGVALEEHKKGKTVYYSGKIGGGNVLEIFPAKTNKLSVKEVNAVD